MKLKKINFIQGMIWGGILTLGWYFRTFNISLARSWLDELDAMKMVRNFSPLESVRIYGQPWLHYALIWLVQKLGDGLNWTTSQIDLFDRYLSVFLSMGAIGGGYYLGKWVFKKIEYAFLVAWIVACMQLQVYYAQEIRMYALWGSLAIWSWALWWKNLNEINKRSVVALTIVNAAMLLTHSLSVIFLVSQIAVAVFYTAIKKKRLSLVIAVNLVLLFVFGLTFVPAVYKYGANYTDREFNWRRIFKPIVDVTEFWPQVRLFRRLSGIEFSKLLGVLSIACLGISAVVKKTRAIGGGILIAFLVSIGSLHVMLALGLLHLFATRYLIFLSGMYALLWPSVVYWFEEKRVVKNVLIVGVSLMYLAMMILYLRENPIHYDLMP